MLEHINFRPEEYVLKNLAYSDSVYAWLLLHSHYDKNEKHNYIYKEEFSYIKIAQQINKTRQTVSKRFDNLVKNGIVKECTYYNKKAYKIPYYQEFEEMHGETVFQLLLLPMKESREELIKTYAYLLKKKREYNKIEKNIFLCSSTEILNAFGHSNGNSEAFSRIKMIFTILQGAGIIKFRTTMAEQKQDGTWRPSYMEIYEVNNKASDEWLGVKKEGINK